MSENQGRDRLSDEPIYNMHAVTQQTGVTAPTLRAWERRYGFPTPQRTASGYRLYSAHDIQLLRWLKEQIDGGMAISQAILLLQGMRDAGQEPVAEPRRAAAVTAAPVATQNLVETGDRLYAAIAHFDQPACEALLDAAFATHSVENVCLNLFQPLLRRVGDGWLQGELNVQMEHFASNLLLERLSSLLHAAPPPHRRERLVAACAPGEQHEIGMLMTALLLRRAGWPVVYLGPNVPVDGILDTVREARPAALLLSATTLYSAPGVLDTADALASADLAAAQRPRLLFGGRIFSALPQLHARIAGAFAGRDATEVIANLDTPRMPPVLAAADPVPAAPLAALAALRSKQEAIAAAVMHALFSPGARQAPDEIAFAHLRVATNNVGAALAAALRLGEPTALAEIGDWAGARLPLHGVKPARLREHVKAYDQAVAQHLPPAAARLVHEYLRHLRAAMSHAKRASPN